MSTPHLHVLYTGGTLGMSPGPQGYAPEPGLLGRLLARSHRFHVGPPPAEPIRELCLPTDDGPGVRYTLNEYDPLLDSANLGVDDWVRIARDIVRLHDQADGFVVLHGTDTMAYTAAALAFMLDGLSKPVVLTGSQIPLCRLRNDAEANVLGALHLAADPRWAEVGVFFHHKLLRGTRTRKVDSGGLDAFDSGNERPLARVGIDVTWDRDALAHRPAPAPQLTLRPITERHVAAIRWFPGLTADVLARILQPPLQGLVLETYGAGNIPDRRADLLAVLREAHDRGVVLTHVTQCFRGHVRPDYAAGQVLADVGVVGGHDMTPECALVKLAWLLSQPALSRDDVRARFPLDHRGELHPSSPRATSP